MNETDRRIRAAIEEVMKAQGMSQREIADALGVKQPSVSQVISGKRGTVPQSLIDVLDVLNLELYVRDKPSTANDQKG